MRDITAKTSTLRTATGKAFVSCQPATLKMIQDQTLPKGEFRDFCRAAGFLGAKHTHLLIPHCHTVSIDGMQVDFEVIDGAASDNEYEIPEGSLGVLIIGQAQSIGRTGIEMEVLTGISMAALTLYDLLKNVDKTVEISGVKLLSKRGGKSDRIGFTKSLTRYGLIVCSDAVAEGKKEQHAGTVAKTMLATHNTENAFEATIAEQQTAVNGALDKALSQELDILFICGGSSIGKRDLVAGVVENRMDGQAPGVISAIEQYAYERTPLMMVSHLVAGYIENTMVVTLPGSQEGVEQALSAILPAVFKAKKMIRK